MLHRLFRTPIVAVMTVLLLSAACAGAGTGATPTLAPTTAAPASATVAPSPSIAASPSASAASTEDPCADTSGGGYGMGGNEYEVTPKPGCDGGAPSPSVDPCDAAGGGTDEYEATPVPGCVSSPSPSVAASAAAGVTLQSREVEGFGAILTDTDGFALYVFDADPEEGSICNDDCAATWPPVVVADVADATAGDGVDREIGTTTRDDGSLQVTYAGRALYRYSGDQEPGEVTGDGVGNVWHVANP
jgi:predicted lipoprotein with Yx(FWY)xxD motif